MNVFEQVQIHESRALPLSYRAKTKRMSGFKKINKTVSHNQSMTWIGEVINEIGQVGLWLQALGVVIVLVIIFDVISFVYNKKKLRQLETIKKNMSRIEKKIDKVVRQTE